MTQNWIIYLLESAVILMFFWMVYWLFLRSETFFKLNRIYLQITLLLSLLIPLFDWVVDIKTADVTNVYILDTIVVTAQKAEVGAIELINHFQWIPLILFMGTIVAYIFFVWGVVKILALARSSKTVRMGKIVFVLNSQFSRPFSFLNYIFISEETYQSNNTHIINHEIVHVKQKHSLDLIFSGIVGAIQWFNPFAWLYREAFREIHEYLADEAVLNQGEDPIRYKKSLFNEAAGFAPGVFSFFNVSFTKRRFKMMSRIKSPRSNALKVLVILPVVALMVVVFACSSDQEIENEVPVTEQKAAMEKQVNTVEKEDVAATDGKVDGEPVYMIVEQMPEYPGGGDALIADISKSVVYPESAKKAGVQAKVFARFTISKKGIMSDIEVLRISSIDQPIEDLDLDPAIRADFISSTENALEALKDWKPGMEKGKPVNVKYMIPIAYRLN
jgi:hypothetical protein